MVLSFQFIKKFSECEYLHSCHVDQDCFALFLVRPHDSRKYSFSLNMISKKKTVSL